MYIINLFMKKSIEKGREKLRNLTETIKIHYNVLAVVFVRTIFNTVVFP